jgi:hypothetical protein
MKDQVTNDQITLRWCATLEITIGAQIPVAPIEVWYCTLGVTDRAIAVSLGRLPTTTCVELRKPRMLMRPRISPIGCQC